MRTLLVLAGLFLCACSEPPALTDLSAPFARPAHLVGPRGGFPASMTAESQEPDVNEWFLNVSERDGISLRGRFNRQDVDMAAPYVAPSPQPDGTALIQSGQIRVALGWGACVSDNAGRPGEIIAHVQIDNGTPVETCVMDSQLDRIERHLPAIDACISVLPDRTMAIVDARLFESGVLVGFKKYGSGEIAVCQALPDGAGARIVPNDTGDAGLYLPEDFSACRTARDDANYDTRPAEAPPGYGFQDASGEFIGSFNARNGEQPQDVMYCLH